MERTELKRAPASPLRRALKKRLIEKSRQEAKQNLKLLALLKRLQR